MTAGVSLAGMKKDDIFFKSPFKDLYELRSKGDFRDEQDDGLMVFQGFLSEFKVDIGFTASRDAKKEFSGRRRALNAF